MAKSKKQIKKLVKKACLFCGESNYDLLDVHRIIPGERQGTYNNYNTVVACCRCHRLIHITKSIIIDKKYNSTKGILLHYWQDGVEYWKSDY